MHPTDLSLYPSVNLTQQPKTQQPKTTLPVDWGVGSLVNYSVLAMFVYVFKKIFHIVVSNVSNVLQWLG